MTNRLVNPGAALKPSEAYQQEITERRTIHSKTYLMMDGTFKVLSTMTAVHYREDSANATEPWKDIDLAITDVAGQMVVSDTLYDLEIYTDKVGYHYVSKNGGAIDVELVEVGRQPVDNERFVVRVEGNQLFWDDVADGVDMKVQLRPLSAEIFKKLAHKDAPRHFRWRVSESAGTNAYFRRKSSGADSAMPKSHIIEMLTEVTPVTVNEFYFDEEWSGRVAVRHPVTRIKEWTSAAVYPVIIDAVTSENIIADIDDGDEFVGVPVWYYSYNTIDIYRLTFGSLHGGFRFRTLGVPQGANIVSANLKFNVIGIVGNPQAKIYGDDVDDAALWSNGNLPSGITKTTANVNWSATATGTNTVNITNVVQEIISRPGWASLNDVRFAVLNQVTGATTVGVEIEDYHAGAGNEAVLEITYVPTPRHPAAYFDGPTIF